MKGKHAYNAYMVINAGISNLTNNTKFVVSGREQLRFDYLEKMQVNSHPDTAMHLV